MNNNLPPNSDNDLEISIVQERIRQGHHSFNAALTVTIVSACISLLGAGLLLSGKIPEGTVTASSGMLASIGCISFAKDANDRLDKLTKELRDED